MITNYSNTNDKTHMRIIYNDVNRSRDRKLEIIYIYIQNN